VRARGAGEHLPAEADAEDRDSVGEGLAQERLLGREPVVPVVLVRVHRAAERHDRVVGGGRSGAAIRRDGPPLETVPGGLDDLLEHPARDARPVREGENAHAPTVVVSHEGSRLTASTRRPMIRASSREAVPTLRRFGRPRRGV
jgi:hypothetical protein